MSNVDKLKYNGVEYDLGKSIDASLTQSGQPADAKEVGDKLNSKVDKIDGKGLSSNDYTTDEKTKLAGIENGANKTLIDTTLVNTGQAADAKSVGDAIASQNTNINAIKKRTDNVENNITILQNNKVDKTTPLLNFDDTATDPLTDDGALANALTALGILTDVIQTGGGSLYLKKALTEILEYINTQYVVETKQTTETPSVAGGGRATVYIDVTKTGYTAIGIVGVMIWGTEVFSIGRLALTYSKTQAVIGIINTYTDARTPDAIDVHVLYRKS